MSEPVAKEETGLVRDGYENNAPPDTGPVGTLRKMKMSRHAKPHMTTRLPPAEACLLGDVVAPDRMEGNSRTRAHVDDVARPAPVARNPHQKNRSPGANNMHTRFLKLPVRVVALTFLRLRPTPEEISMLHVLHLRMGHIAALWCMFLRQSPLAQDRSAEYAQQPKR